MVRNCSLFLRKFSTPLVCFHIPPSLLSAHLLWHWIAVSPGDSQVTCLEPWPLTGCTAASQGHAAQLVPPVPQTTGPEAAFNDVTFSTYCEVACVCFDLLFIQLLFHLILSSVPIPSPISPKKKNPSLLVPFHKTSMTSRHSHYFDFQNKIIRWMSLIRKIILENLTSICYITPFLWLLDLICCISRLERELLSFPDGSVYEHLNNFYSS